MSQQRIDYFFPRVSIKKGSNISDAECRFLALQPKIRLQIYYEAGLQTRQIIHLNNWRPSKRRFDDRRLWETNYHPGRWDPSRIAQEERSAPLPVNLLAVCRSVHDEVRAAMYGENRFVIANKMARALRALENMSDSTLRAMTFLTIRFNVSSCENWCCGGRTCVCDNAGYECRNPKSHDVPLDLSTNSGEVLISQWQRICVQLTRALQPGNLALYVICDCANAETARVVSESLSLLPTLRDCGIRLAIQYNEEISVLARDAVLSLTRTSQPVAKPFRFLDLPEEIKFRILKDTALCNSTVSFHQYGFNYGRRCKERGRVSKNVVENYCVDSRPLLQCFCSYAHSAFYLRCNCRDNNFPSPFFSVSREFASAAKQVFFSKNKFVLCITGPNTDKSIYSQSRFPLLDENITDETNSAGPSFISRLARFPRSSIKFLTELRLEVPWLDKLECFLPSHSGWKYWLDTIYILSREANLRALTLEIDIQEELFSWKQLEGNAFSDIIADPEYEDRMLQTYKTFIQPMSVLHGLKKLFIYLNWESTHQVSDRRQKYETILEKIVMGDDYNAAKYGKGFQHPGSVEESTYLV